MRFLEVVGVIFMIAVSQSVYLHSPVAIKILFALVVAEYLFLKFCAVRRWYKCVPRGFGIELQFEKSMVPAAYALPLVSLSVWADFSPVAVMAFCLVVLGAMVYVNSMLLLVRLSDKSTIPVNHYSSGAFLKR